MTDTYTRLVSKGPGRDVAKKLGLPQPAALRRYEPGQPLPAGPVLVIGASAGADDLARELLDWDVEVRRHAVAKERLGAIVLVLDDLQSPADLEQPVLTAGPALRERSEERRVGKQTRSGAG